MKLNPGKDPNAVVLETSVVEQKTGTFSIGGGYSKADGLIGIIEIGDNNFRGTGDKIKLHWEFGGDAEDGGQNYSLGYTRPWLDSKQTSLSFNVYDMTNEYSDYSEGGKLQSTYDKNRKGWEVTVGRPSGEYIQNYLTYRNNTDKYVDWVDGANYETDPLYTDQNYLKNNFGETHSLILNRVFDSRDNIFNPTEGKRYSLSTEFAGNALGLGGEFNYEKYTAEGRQFLKVGKSQVVALKATVGYADGQMPENSKFSVGGADSLRGYEDDQFKGDKMIAATAEYRFPVAQKVQGVVFTDVGKAWNDNLDGLKAGVGVGVRVQTPIGPIRLDVAKGDEGTRTHFSFGGQF
jgi:outer membrane protein insertion porin family